MDTTPQRGPTEAWDLASRVVELYRCGAARVTLLAAADQTRTSVRREPYRGARRALAWIVEAIVNGEQDDACVEATLRVAARELTGRSEGGPQ